MALNIGGMYVLYLTPLYVLSLTNPWLHHLIHLHFLLAGYLFSWSIIGPDPVPNRPSIRFRMIVLFLQLPYMPILASICMPIFYLPTPHFRLLRFRMQLR
nr:hypothetical protein [Cytophagales bacterium]